MSYPILSYHAIRKKVHVYNEEHVIRRADAINLDSQDSTGRADRIKGRGWGRCRAGLMSVPSCVGPLVATLQASTRPGPPLLSSGCRRNLSQRGTIASTVVPCLSKYTSVVLAKAWEIHRQDHPFWQGRPEASRSSQQIPNYAPGTRGI